MKLHASLISVIAFALLTNAAFAGEPIDGAFGYKLGDKYAGSVSEINAGADGKFRSGDFKPDSPVAPFTYYTVTLTPESRVIYEVFVKGEFPTKEAAIDFLQAMQSKYGSFAVSPGSSFSYASYVHTTGDREVRISVIKGTLVMVAYRDNQLIGIAKMEGLTGKVATRGAGF